MRLKGFRNLTELPESIEKLSALASLHVENCETLTQLPKTICKLSALENLTLVTLDTIEYDMNDPKDYDIYEGISERIQLMHLPSSIGLLQSLKTFCLMECNKLGQLPTSIGALTSLYSLHVVSSVYSKLELPASFSLLTGLQILKLSGCKMPACFSLDIFTKLQTLEWDLEVPNCESYDEDLYGDDQESVRSERKTALVSSLPALKQFQCLHLNKPGSDDDFLQLARSLKAWPPPLLGDVVIRSGYMDITLG